MKPWLAALVTSLLCSAVGHAQSGPHGPAEVMGQARQARDARDMQQAGQRGAGVQNPHTTPADAPPANPHTGIADAQEGAEANPHAGLAEPAERPPLATERADSSLPDGTIRVRVREANGAPAVAAEVTLGIMASDSTHTTRSARTSANGIVELTGLASGERQAYRVNVPYQGAKYSSTPFRLPQRGGYEVEIRRLPVTRDDRMVVLYLGATSIELKDDRIKIVQEAQLLNIGAETYVFPESGTLVRLPQGFTAVQTQESMGDQHAVEAPHEGLRLHGSLPPGEATMLWGFDLPLAGSQASFGIDLPWVTFAYRVLSDAPSGMTLQVDGMPEPQLHTDAGRRFLVTETQRKVGDPPFRRLQISLRGMPGPGPERWIAAALAMLVLFSGVTLARRGQRADVAVASTDIDARRAELIERARQLHTLRETGEIGPEYHGEQWSALTDDLAALLFEQAELKRAPKPQTQRARA
jgi:hypothetical protein